jgi:hypothetical protein
MVTTKRTKRTHGNNAAESLLRSFIIATEKRESVKTVDELSEVLTELRYLRARARYELYSTNFGDWEIIQQFETRAKR